MNAQQIRLVRDSWSRLLHDTDALAAVFYDRLFTIDPGLRPLFSRTTMVEQERKLTQALALVVAGLDRLDALLPAIQNMGRRHVGYGVKDEHYVLVGRALLWTLGHLLGDAFGGEVCDAWTTAYSTLAGAMREAAAEVEAEAVAAARAVEEAALLAAAELAAARDELSAPTALRPAFGMPRIAPA
jgi:hemoglobin-like flavoprotein